MTSDEDRALFDAEDDGVSLGHIHHALENEREHCEQVVRTILADEHDYSENLTEAFMRERAAARAQGDAQGYKRGFKGGQDAVDDAVQARHELGELQSKNERIVKEWNSMNAALLALQSKYNTLTTAAQELAGCIEYVAATGAWTRESSTEDIYDLAARLRAALGPAPAPEEKT